MRNNIKSLLFHIVISILSILIYFPFNLGQPKWVSEEAAINHHNKMMIVAFLIFTSAVILYFLIGRLILVSEGSLRKNLSAVSLPAKLGIFIWIIAFVIDRFGPSDALKTWYQFNI
mgnify:CR=1 FL=1